MAIINTIPDEPPSVVSPRFQMELEFVSCLANPAYLQYLGITFPNLFIPSESTDAKAVNGSKQKQKREDSNSDAACFARYLKYLLDYWQKPEYVQYLTHPAATIRNLELLQVERFRRDVTRPDLMERLSEGFTGVNEDRGTNNLLDRIADADNPQKSTETDNPETSTT